jgi:hypothetical protein
MGGFDPHIFTLGSRRDMLDEAKRCIDKAASGGGYILPIPMPSLKKLR